MASINKLDLINEIAYKSMLLAKESIDEDLEDELFISEYKNQLQTSEHNEYLRAYIGSEIEAGNKKAVEIMKLIIRFNLMVSKANKMKVTTIEQTNEHIIKQVTNENGDYITFISFDYDRYLPLDGKINNTNITTYSNYAWKKVGKGRLSQDTVNKLQEMNRFFRNK